MLHFSARLQDAASCSGTLLDWLTSNLAISGYPSSNTDLSGLSAIVNLDRYTPYTTTVRFEHMPLIDGPGNAPSDVARVVWQLDELLESGKVLLHCAAGVSRTPFVAALYLAWKRPMEFDEALELTAQRRSRELNIDIGLLAVADPVLALLQDERG